MEIIFLQIHETVVIYRPMIYGLFCIISLWVITMMIHEVIYENK